ncbi:Transcriptional regulatory protein DegU [subsurface metagenome]
MSGQIEKKTTILLADDQRIVRQGIRALLEREADFEVVGEADNTLEVISLVRELKPDVIVMQARRPTLGSMECIRRVKAEYPQTEVLILTMYQEEEYVAELLRSGAAGYLLKTIEFQELVQAIRTVRAGEVVCDAAMIRRIMKRTARAQPVAIDYGEHLTRRETEVLNLAAKGMSNHDIAIYFGLKEGTVKGYFVNIFDKMGVGSRIEAVLEAIRRGWISPEDKLSPRRK